MNDFAIILILAYLLSLLSVILTRYVRGITGNILAYLISFLTFFIAAFRPDNFPDVDTYQLIFDEVKSNSISSPLFWLIHGEPGFKFIIKILQNLNLEYRGFLIFMSMLSYYLLYTIAKISKTPFSFLWFTYLSFYFVTRDLGVLRLSIASHLIILSLLQTKNSRRLLLVFLASFVFQYFAFIILSVFLFSRIKLKIERVIILLIICLFASSQINFSLFENFIPEKQIIAYAGTSQVENSESSSFIPILRNMIMAMLIYFLYRFDLEKNVLKYWIISIIFSVAIYLLTFNILIVSQRFGAYFGAILPLAFAYKLSKNSVNNSLYVLIVILCIANFITVFYYNDFVWKLT